MLPKIVVTLVLGTPKHLELGLIFQKWPPALHLNFHRFNTLKTAKKTPQKAQKWKLAKFSLNDAKRSIQKPIAIYLGNMGSVKVVSVISFHRKCHFWMPKVGHFGRFQAKVPIFRHSKMALLMEWNNRYNFYTPQIPQKCYNWLLNWAFCIIQWNFGQFPLFGFLVRF